MWMLAQEPMRLMAGSVPDAAASSGPWWPAWALWGGIAAIVMLCVDVARRLIFRPRDPYDRLLRGICDAAGVPEDVRVKLMMRAGGDAQRATGLLLLRAIRDAERISA